MKRIFLSADIEGTCGIAHWDETEKTKGDYGYFANQMSLEVAAACNGALSGGAQALLVKDAHDSARNINPNLLPKEANIFRGWPRDPYMMMSGIEEGDFGAFFTGYHSAAGTDFNPLAHTMNGQNNYVKINGEIASELYINALTAAMFGVPIRFVSGDEGLCEWIKTKVPGVTTVATTKGCGNGAISIHPQEALAQIKAGAEKAMATPREDCLFTMPETFEVEINYKYHYLAKRSAFYPGCTQKDSHSVVYKASNYMDVLRFMLFCL